MDFEYYFNENEYGLQMKILPNDNIEGDIFMIEAWLEGDVQRGEAFLKSIKNFIEKSDKKEEKLGGNSCELLLKKDFTIIRWNWYDEMPNSCTLPTQMLYEILQIWIKKNKEIQEDLS